jgi:RND superfamily putative drug exporter
VDPAANQPASFLPADTPHSLAAAEMRRAFPQSSGLSEAVVVFERSTGPLTSDDRHAIEVVAGRISLPGELADAEDLAGINIRSPGSLLLNPNPLVSPASDAGQAGLIIVAVPANFVTMRSDRVVDHIYEVLSEADLPAGLKVSVTGSSGFGHDYADAAETSHARTLRVTVIAVILILLIVYRSPLAAMVPLVAISLAAFVAMKVLAFAQQLGLAVGTAERIFVIVLIYGAGTDYSLFFTSRFREFLEEGFSAAKSSAQALNATFPAILASAGTDTAGLLMLCFAEYGIFRTTGPAVAVALLVALTAAVTLVPALVALVGWRVFWPAKPTTGTSRTLGIGRKRI